MTKQTTDLAEFGWNAFFASQLDPDDPASFSPARVMAVHRGGLIMAGPGVDSLIPPFNAPGGEKQYEVVEVRYE